MQSFIRDCRGGLLALDGLEQRLEIALAETAAALALDHFEEQRRPVLHRAGEDLQHVAFVVAVHQDAEFLQLVERLVDLPDARQQIVVVGGRHAQKLHALPPQRRHRLDDVVGGHGDVLHAGAAVKLQVLFDLRFALARRPAR